MSASPSSKRASALLGGRDFARRLVAWQRTHGRHDLPWQPGRHPGHTPDPYKTWVAEVMLQQTQVQTVTGYFERFLLRFPDVATLAQADVSEVLTLWSGLGYYARARNLHRAAQMIASEHGGVFPREITAIAALPGVGRSTAAAIAGFSFNARHAILDGNVKRVLARHFGIAGYPAERAVQGTLWELAESLLPAAEAMPAYLQAQMDLGATLCLRTRPRCADCPVRTSCIALRDGRIDELPGRRPAKPMPERATAMLIVIHAGEVLLERRPPTGIWGGLWSFPESAPDRVAETAAAKGWALASEKPWPVLAHGFTHFRLAIHPWVLELSRRPHGIAQPGQVWMTTEDALGAAIPKPVKTLLKKL